MFYSKSTGGFYERETHDVIPHDAVEITSDYRWELIDGQSDGKVIVADENGFPALQDPPPPPPPDPKMVGVEFEGVMCSATRDDQNGLVAVIVAYELQKSNFQPTEFRFVNGTKLVLTFENLPAFLKVWMPFRQSFFAPEATND